MSNSKLLIPVSLFIICNAIYDGFGLLQNTNWSIFYYTAQYFSWLVLVYLLIKKPYTKLKNIPYYTLALGLIIYIIIELSKLGMPYKDYYESVNSFEQIILPIAVILTGLTYFIIKLCRQ